MPEPRPETPPMFPQSILSDSRVAARLSLLQSLLADSGDSDENPTRVLRLQESLSDPEMFSTLVSLLEVQNQNQLAMEEEERCDFDLCSSCAEKEEIENVCSRGHQLHPVQLSGDSIYHWICDGCGYQCSPEEKLDVVEVLRCQKDKRYPDHEVAQPSRFKWFKRLKLLKWFQKKRVSSKSSNHFRQE